MSAGAGCPLCGGRTGAATYEAREMMLGTRERFHYGECGACGTLVLLDVPSDLGRYYPDDYYSLRPTSADQRAAIRRHWQVSLAFYANDRLALKHVRTHAIQYWHSQVHQHHIRRMPIIQCHALNAISRQRHHLKIRLPRQHPRQPLPHHWMIVYDKNLYFVHSFG